MASLKENFIAFCQVVGVILIAGAIIYALIVSVSYVTKMTSDKHIQTIEELTP